MIGGEVAAVGVVSYCFVGDNDYAPIGLGSSGALFFSVLCFVLLDLVRRGLLCPFRF